MLQSVLYSLPVLGLLGLVYVFWKSAWIGQQDAGTDKMKKIAGHIAEGAMAFLKAEYRILAVYVVVAGIGLGFL